MKLKDSGERREFSTGSVRDFQSNKGRFDLAYTHYDVSLALAQLMEAGCQKYGDRNWELGQPMGALWDSTMRHSFKHGAGYRDEPHGVQALWGWWAMLTTEARIARGELPAKLWTLPEPKPSTVSPPLAWDGLTSERLRELVGT